jgi:hypothetical protein
MSYYNKGIYWPLCFRSYYTCSINTWRIQRYFMFIFFIRWGVKLHSFTHPLTYTLIHSPTHPLTHSSTHPHTHTLTHPLAQPPTTRHPLTHSSTHPHTHSLTHSPTHPLLHPSIQDQPTVIWDHSFRGPRYVPFTRHHGVTR